MALGDRLRLARQRIGLTLEQVKERTGIGQSSLSEFEGGKREPSLSQLQALARTYQRAISFFLGEGEPRAEAVLWRERPQIAEEVEARFLRLCEQYHNLEVWCNERAAVRVPTEEGAAQGFGYPQAESLAKRVRDQLQLGDRPGPVLLRVLEEACGVKVFHLDFQPTGTAAATVSETHGAAVLLNSASAPRRRNFDLAHELFHLLTWRVFRSGGTPSQAPAAEEKLAQAFACNLLMPADAVRVAVDTRLKGGRIPIAALYDIAREFDVSVAALLWRMHHLLGRGPADEERTQADINRVKACGPLYEERRQEKPPIYPARYHALAVKALRLGEISAGRFAEYLGISRQQALRYIEQETADDEEVQVAPA